MKKKRCNSKEKEHLGFKESRRGWHSGQNKIKWQDSDNPDRGRGVWRKPQYCTGGGQSGKSASSGPEGRAPPEMQGEVRKRSPSETKDSKHSTEYIKAVTQDSDAAQRWKLNSD